MPSLSLSHEAVHLFLRGFQGWLLDGNIPVLPGSEVDSVKPSADSSGTPNPHMFRPGNADKVGRKWAWAEQTGRVVEAIHVPDAYTDGSYAEEGPGGGGGVFADYGVWFGALHSLNISSPLPGPIQTNNRVELTACIEALRAIPLSQPLRIITNNKYVYDGVTLYMHRWALQDRGVTNQDLWESLKAVLQARSAETLWKHVYSHVGIVGNERADSLANQGRRRHQIGCAISRTSLPVRVSAR